MDKARHLHCLQQCRTNYQGCIVIYVLFSLLLKVVTNEKGEAVGEVLTIIC